MRAASVRIRKRVHLDGEGAFALEVGASHVELGSGQRARVDLSLQFEVGVRLQAARSPRRGHAACQVETRSAVRRLAIERHATLGLLRHGIEEMFVHADQAGDHGLSRHVQHLGVGRISGLCAPAAWTAVILPPAMSMRMSSWGAEPVPSIRRTCSSTSTGASSFT